MGWRVGARPRCPRCVVPCEELEDGGRTGLVRARLWPPDEGKVTTPVDQGRPCSAHMDHPLNRALSLAEAGLCQRTSPCRYLGTLPPTCVPGNCFPMGRLSRVRCAGCMEGQAVLREF